MFESKFYDLNRPIRFKVVDEITFLPWIYKTKIIRIKDNKSYKIDFNKEFRISTLIISEDYVYTTNNYNIYEVDSLKYSFTKYRLK